MELRKSKLSFAGETGVLALLFLKLGTIAFGGPAAHIAMTEDEVVRRGQWLTRDEFLDLLVATNLIPGPNSTEMAIHIGHRRAGFPGLIVAGLCFHFAVPFTLCPLFLFFLKVGSVLGSKLDGFRAKPRPVTLGNLVGGAGMVGLG